MNDDKYLRFCKIYYKSDEPSKAWKSIKPALSEYLGSLEQNHELLEKLYVPINSKKYEISHLATAFFNISPLEIERFEKDNSKHSDLTEHIFSKSGSDRFFDLFILAPIGKGKTTFIYHTLLVDLPTSFPEFKWKPIFIDVTKCKTGYDEYLQKITYKIDKTITESFECLSSKTDADLLMTHKTLCEIFQQDLLNKRIGSKPANKMEEPLYEKQNNFFSELEKQNFEYFQQKRLAYAQKKEPNTFIILVIDNMDQHTEHQREKMIVDAYAIASSIRIPLIITLRDTSFRNNNPHSILSSYKPDYFCLDTVPTSKILAKRFKNLYRDFKGKKENEMGFKFMKILEKQFDDIPENKIGHTHFSKTFPWISNVANKSNRKALDVIEKSLESKFITQGDFDRYPQKVNEIELIDSKIHVKKLQTALLIRNNNYFIGDDSDANFINLFDCNIPTDRFNYILRFKILQYFNLDPLKSKKVGDVVNTFLEVLGDEHKQILLTSLKIMVEKGLLFIYDQSNIDNSTDELWDTNINIENYLEDDLFFSFNGLFHINDLIYNDVYLDEMKFSTNINKNDFNHIFEKYKDGFKPLHRVYRNSSTERFIKYIIKYEKKDGAYIDEKLKTNPIMEDVFEKYKSTCDETDWFKAGI